MADADAGEINSDLGANRPDADDGNGLFSQRASCSTASAQVVAIKSLQLQTPRRCTRNNLEFAPARYTSRTEALPRHFRHIRCWALDPNADQSTPGVWLRLRQR